MTLTSRRSLLRGAAGGALALGAAATPGIAQAAAPRTLSVLAINIWLGGTVVPPGRELVTKVIRESGADVVLLSESGDATAWLAEDLSTGGERWWYADSSDTGILSRFPIVETGRLPFITKAVIDVEGRQVATYAAHLEYRWYATYLPRGYAAGVPSGPYAGWDQLPGGPVTDLATVLQVNADSGRPEVIRAFLADAEQEQRRRRSVILGGDFNEPSVLDWTDAARNLFDHHGLAVPWQSTAALDEAGYVDAYRTVWPDEVRYPGFTWAVDNRSVDVSSLTWTPRADERDRIDYVFASPSPGLKLLGSGIIGPQGSIVRNERVPEATTEDFISHPEPWPTDHKAVLATYRLAGPPAKR